MKKNLISVIALICAFCALAVALWAGVRAGQLQAQVDNLKLENEALTRQLQSMQTEAPAAESPAGVGYCNLLIDDWSYENNALTVISGFVQVGEAAAEPDVAVSLRQGGSVLHRIGIETVSAEGSGSYEARLKNVTFDQSVMPELQEGDWLELWLEVTTGSTESLCVAEWHLENGELQLVAG